MSVAQGVEVQRGAVGLVGDHHAGHVGALLVPRHQGHVPGQDAQGGLQGEGGGGGVEAGEEAADRALLPLLGDGLERAKQTSDVSVDDGVCCVNVSGPSLP